MPTILIVVEAPGQQLAQSAIELASEARRLADALGAGGTVSALVAGANAQSLAPALGAYGVDRVLAAQENSLLAIAPEWLLAAALEAARRETPDVVLLTHAGNSRQLGPELAFQQESGAVTDCTRVRVEGGEILVTKPVFGGSALAEMVVKARPPVLTLRPRAFEAAEPIPGREASVDTLPVTVANSRVQVLEEVREESSGGPRLKDAKIIVSGGRGLGAAENWRQVEELAQVLGAAVGASRAVTDAGWVAPSLQVGLTGTAVAPDLYVAIGISGAVQHIAGITSARNVVAINKDAEANIFKYARFGVVGDWKQVLPAFTERLKQLRS